MDDKAIRLRYLRSARDGLLSKVDGLSEYDVRRPLTVTGTNLLGLVKHNASVQIEYFGLVFGRPSGVALPWTGPDAPPDANMWAAATESVESIVELHHRSAAHSDATIAALGLDAPGQVPWWPPERRGVTLGQIMVHMIAETARHAGHADILRELIDGSTGRYPGDPNADDRSADDWARHRTEVEAAARRADCS